MSFYLYLVCYILISSFSLNSIYIFGSTINALAIEDIDQTTSSVSIAPIYTHNIYIPLYINSAILLSLNIYFIPISP